MQVILFPVAYEGAAELEIEAVKPIKEVRISPLRLELKANISCEKASIHIIHAGDRAAVKDITYENIRIQHYYDKLIDFRVMRSMYNKDEERGQIRNIRLKNIRVKESIYNPGYSISLIGGYDEAHIVEDVIFEDFYLNERKIWNGDQLDLHVKNAKNIIFV